MTLLDFLQNCTVFSEGLCAFVGILYFKKLKETFWKYFVFYCVIIFLNELFSLLVLEYYQKWRSLFFDVYGIPIQFLFLFWLYAYQSLQLKKLYFISTLVYLLSFIPHLYYKEKYGIINSMSYTVACLLLLLMGILEFLKQIRSNDILNFNKNKMFYINLGMLLFYIGTMPFYAFMRQLYDYDPILFSNYRIFSLVTDILLYLLFTASFIWGKPKT